MAKSIDYSKIRAMASSILECIGDCDEGEDPKIPKQKEDIDDGGQDSALKFLPGDKGSDDEGQEKKKFKGSSLALMASTLASKFK